MNEELSMTALEYVLGTLPADERAAFAQQVSIDSEARAALEDWEHKLAPLAAVAQPVAADAAIWRAIEQRLEPVASGGNVVALKQSIKRWRVAATAMSALAASLALYVSVRPPHEIVRPSQSAALQTAPTPAAPSAPAVASRAIENDGIATASASRQNENLVVTANGPREGVVHGGLNIQPTREPGPPATYVAALSPASAPAALIVRADPSAHAIVVRRLSAGVAAGSELRLWLLVPGAPPKALGVVGDESARLALPREVALAGAAIAASIEPAGSTAEAPSGPFVYEGKLVRE